MDFIRRDVDGSSGGMLIGINELLFDLVDHILFDGIYCLTVVVRRKSDGWNQMVTVVYGQNQRELQKDMWEEMWG